jgi:uncharacterized membrane protein YgaE (UPF0421/DUF939 family)
MKKHRPIIGIRIWKTSLCVLMIHLISQLFHYPVSPINAYIAGIMSMKDNTGSSINYGVKRTLCTVVGGGVALAALHTISQFEGAPLHIVNAISYPLGVGAILVICSRMGLGDLSALGAAIYLIAIIGYSGVDIFVYVFERTLETIAGIVISVLINRYFLPRHSSYELELAADEKDDE